MRLDSHKQNPLWLSFPQPWRKGGCKSYIDKRGEPLVFCGFVVIVRFNLGIDEPLSLQAQVASRHRCQEATSRRR